MISIKNYIIANIVYLLKWPTEEDKHYFCDIPDENDVFEI